MKLRIENFAKIKKADFEIDGITIIAGKNDTGKSTVGKILFSAFNGSSDIETRIVQEKRRSIQRNSRIILNNYSASDIPISRQMHFARSISNRLLSDNIIDVDYDYIKDAVLQTIETIAGDQWIDDKEEVSTELAEQLYTILTLPDDKLRNEVISRYFNEVFNEQINSLYNSNIKADVEMNIKNKIIEFSFFNNRCSIYKSELDLAKKVIYIDNPFILNKLYSGFGGPHEPLTERFLKDLLLEKRDKDLIEGIIDSVIAREKLEEIHKTLNAIIPGKLVEGQDGRYSLECDNYDTPVYVENLSTGIKSFLIIEMLLERGKINEKDVLIFDEPEIHLHPEWQLKYAEIIVLLQKSFDLSIVVTTHSRDFLEAIELYSRKYEIESKCNYYMSSLDDGGVIFEKVSGNIEKVYAQLVKPSILLDDLRYKIGTEDDD